MTPTFAEAFSLNPQVPVDDKAHLLAALKAAYGQMLNVKIDLETGKTKQHAAGALERAIKAAEAAIAKAEDC